MPLTSLISGLSMECISRPGLGYNAIIAVDVHRPSPSFSGVQESIQITEEYGAVQGGAAPPEVVAIEIPRASGPPQAQRQSIPLWE
jgi:hypothetical protein